MICADIILGETKDYGTEVSQQTLDLTRAPEGVDSVEGTENHFGIHDTWVHQYVPLKQYGENLFKIFTTAKAALEVTGIRE
mgnify:CR=1 FL=1